MGGLVVTLTLVKYSAIIDPRLDRGIVACLAAPLSGPGWGPGGAGTCKG